MNPPFSRDVHINTLLTDRVEAYNNLPDSYIADHIFPMKSVAKQFGRFAYYDKSIAFRDDVAIRAPSAVAEETGWGTNFKDYRCDNYALRHPITAEDMENSSAPFDLFRDASLFLDAKHYLKRDRLFAQDHFIKSAWGSSVRTTLSGSSQWSDYTNSDPMIAVDDGKDAVQGLTARDPNIFVISRPVWTKLKHHPKFLQEIRYTQRGIVTMDIMADMLDVDMTLVGKTIYASNPAALDEDDVTYSRVWGNHALLVHRSPSQMMFDNTAGYTVYWSPIGPNAMHVVRTYEYTDRIVQWVEVLGWYQQLVLDNDLGYFWENAIA